MKQTDVVIVGAGAAGLMCAIEAGKRGRQVTVLDSSNKPGKKILMSGGGRCNFTNLNICPEAYLSHNAHFCKSALKRYTQWDFIHLVEKHGIAYHEKTLGQLFCDNKAKDIVNMLLKECEDAAVTIKLDQNIKKIEGLGSGFYIKTDHSEYQADACVIACGGLSIPTLGSSPFGYKVAQHFGHPLWPTRAGLVPFTLHKHDLNTFGALSGVSQPCKAKVKNVEFKENMLFTHRGLSGPAMLQLSSYWQPGETLLIDFLPEIDLSKRWQQDKIKHKKQSLKHYLSQWLPARLLHTLLSEPLLSLNLSDISNKQKEALCSSLKAYPIQPNATEGYRTAEVTLGGVDCDSLCSKTMQSKLKKNLYFIGEVVDVTGWLGGYNFQWAWSSGWAAGQVV